MGNRSIFFNPNITSTIEIFIGIYCASISMLILNGPTIIKTGFNLPLTFIVTLTTLCGNAAYYYAIRTIPPEHLSLTLAMAVISLSRWSVKNKKLS